MILKARVRFGQPNVDEAKPSMKTCFGLKKTEGVIKFKLWLPLRDFSSLKNVGVGNQLIFKSKVLSRKR